MNKKVAVIGLAGKGKSTIVSKLTQSDIETGGGLKDLTTKCKGYMDKVTNIEFWDTPGFVYEITSINNGQIQKVPWWDEIQKIGLVHQIIIMINGTDERLSDMGDFAEAFKYLMGFKPIIIAIHGNKFKYPGIPTYYWKELPEEEEFSAECKDFNLYKLKGLVKNSLWANPERILSPSAIYEQYKKKTERVTILEQKMIAISKSLKVVLDSALSNKAKIDMIKGIVEGGVDFSDIVERNGTNIEPKVKHSVAANVGWTLGIFTGGYQRNLRAEESDKVKQAVIRVNDRDQTVKKADITEIPKDALELINKNLEYVEQGDVKLSD